MFEWVRILHTVLSHHKLRFQNTEQNEDIPMHASNQTFSCKFILICLISMGNYSLFLSDAKQFVFFVSNELCHMIYVIESENDDATVTIREK